MKFEPSVLVLNLAAREEPSCGGPKGTARHGRALSGSASRVSSRWAVATAYYFLHFLVILPVLGFKEKTIPVPLSITESVLGGSPNLAVARNKESFEKSE